MIERIEIGVLTTNRISDKESGRAILRLLEPSYTPRKYSVYEPIRIPYSVENIDTALKQWGDINFLWRGGPRVQGSAWMGAVVHDSVYLTLPLRAFDLSEVLRFVAGIGNLSGIVIGYIHISTRADSDDLDYYDVHISDYSQGLNTHQLKEGLPGLCWATFFGKPYQRLFDEKLSSVPAHFVEDIGGATYIQLTENIQDVDKKRDEYEAAQQAAIKHLDSNAFRVMGKARKYNVPEFNL